MTKKSFASSVLALLVAASLLLSAGCSTSCEAEADKKFAVIKSGINNFIPKGWILAYEQTSGCDSWDDPWVTIELSDSVTSTDVTGQMTKDNWKQLSQRYATPYLGGEPGFVLQKGVGDELLVATVLDYRGGKEMEVKVEN